MIVEFVFHPFSINFSSDDDEASMTKGQFKQLNKKIDLILEYSHAFSSTKWENLLRTHQATVEMLITSNVKLIEESSKATQATKKRIIEVSEKVQ